MIEMLIRLDAKFCFAYPGGASMPLHQALRKHRDRIRTILPRHEQGGTFAAQGIARTTGRPGICMATSGPGATNLVTGIADAKLDSVPLIAITGQVPQHFIGKDAFQETPMVEVCRAITKHTYMITDVHDVARIVREAFHIATTGRPGPVLIDFPKDVQTAELQRDEVDFNPPFKLPGYQPQTRRAREEQIAQVIAAIRRSRRPVIYVGGGCIISGGRVQNTVLAPNVRINSYADVRESVLMENVTVGRHCRVRRAIIDKDVSLPEGTQVGYDLEADARRFTVTPSGLVVIPKGTTL